MRLRPRTGLSATVCAAVLVIGMAAPASGTIHEIVASFCSGGNGNLFPPGQSAFGSRSFLRALQATGAVTVRPNTPTAGAITVDYNNDAPAGKFTGNDVFVQAVPGIWVEVLDPDHAAFEHCANLVVAG